MFSPQLNSRLSRVVLRRRIPLRPHRRLQSSQSGPGKSQLPPQSPAPIPVPGAATATPLSKPVLPLWQRLGPLTRVAEAYSRSQRQRPYATQIASAIFIYLCADLGAQQIGGKEYDLPRTLRALGIGTVAAIPSYEWFLFLSRNFNYSSRLLSLTVKVVVNQAFMSPLFNVYFFGAQALLSGEDLAGAGQRIRDTVPTSIVTSWKVWPAISAVSFAFVPMEHRAVFSGSFAIGWQAYLSYLNKNAEVKEKKQSLLVATAQQAAQMETQPIGIGVQALTRYNL
ncbi:PXMP2/4 family protein [Paramyrothecium foliicola]|nr:PXMP2/4 family protein [Paramyrothecium foliicola]